MTIPESEQNQSPTVHFHERIINNFAELEIMINALLFARNINGRRGAEHALQAHQQTLTKARFWLPQFTAQMKDGWLLQQKATDYQEKGEQALINKFNEREIQRDADKNRNSVVLSTELNIAQFMALLTVGMLSKMKSVNFNYLNRTKNLGGDKAITSEPSFWMFNWEPEIVFGQLMWLTDTAYWVLTTPGDLAEKYPHQILKFGHFVSAFIVAGQERSTETIRTFKRKERENSIKRPRHIIMRPADMIIEDPQELPYETDEEVENNPSTYNGTVPQAFFDEIDGLNF